MKKYFLLTIVLLTFRIAFAQSVAINTDGSTPHSSAIVDIKSTNKGLLAPRMTLSQRDLINSPATGLMIYQTDNTPGYYFYNGSAWTQLATGWSANGSNIYNNNTGNIGIGTSTPVNKLQIGNIAAGFNGNDIAIGNGTQTMSFFQSATTSNWYTSTNFALLPGPGGTGNVGIGTSTPANRLTVQTGNGYGIIHTNGTVSVGTYVGNALGPDAGWFGTKSDHPLMFFTNNGGAQLTILQNGNTGIGTTAPDATLDVARGTAFNGTALFRGLNYNSVFNYGGNEDTYISGGKSTGLVILNGQSQGNVGIGTVAPVDKLTVLTATGNYGITHTDGTITAGSYVGSGAGWFGTKTNHPLYFFTNNGNAQLAIQPNGQVSINGGLATYLSPKLTINGGLTLKDDFASPFNEWNIQPGSTTDALLILLDGNIKANVNNAGEWIDISDISVKENILPYKSVLRDINNLNISTYRYKSNSPDSRSFGLIAQNVAQYFPEIVSEIQDKEGHKMLGVAYGKTGVLALKAVQEQQVIIETQQRKINELETRLAVLEKIIYKQTSTSN